MVQASKIRVSYADEKKVIFSQNVTLERKKYDEDSWLDMIQQIRNEYWIYKDKEEMLGNIATPLERVESLATTPMEKAHSKAALSVVRRIVAGETQESGYTGHWNFFEKRVIRNDNGKIITAQNHRWSFELKRMHGAGQIDTPLLYNDIYGILEDATKCIWSDEWRIGMAPTVEYDKYGQIIKTQITCEDGIYYVEAPWLESVMRTVDMDDYSSLQYFQRVLKNSGIIDRLREMGINEGDTVDIFGFEFDFVN